MEMHMVHINSKYINEDGTLDPGYGSNIDGVAVLGFMFKVKKSEVNRVILYKKIIYISLYTSLRLELFIYFSLFSGIGLIKCKYCKNMK